MFYQFKYNDELKSTKIISQDSEDYESDSPTHKGELKNVGSISGKRRNYELYNYDSSVESDGDQSPSELITKKNQMKQKKVIQDASPSLISIMQKYCKKNSTSKFE